MGKVGTPRRKDLHGKRFGKLTVSEFAYVKSGNAWWVCQCDCGNTKVIRAGSLLSGGITSCGCLKKRPFHKTHGLSQHRLYSIYKDMGRRCNDPKNKSYSQYGGIGIKVCKEWSGAENFLNFYNWAMSHGYDEALTLDRIDCNGDYCPENCRWADVETQANNKRNNDNITINGVTKSKAQWAREYGISYRTICSRLNHGVDPVLAVTTPVGKCSFPKKNASSA